MIRIRPLCGKVLLRLVDRSAWESSGGVLTRSPCGRGSRREAVVQALPSGFAGDISVGDVVFVKPYAGTEIKLNGERVVLCKECEIEAVLE